MTKTTNLYHYKINLKTPAVNHLYLSSHLQRQQVKKTSIFIGSTYITALIHISDNLEEDQGVF